ncbi:MAG: tRNA (guanosine(37)-N1)-methyltransferase TrmD [Elusimicrobia bacterium CG1_02_37_114]|nr:MAG: tRNA (guanosine(37)-N1)-methyltransferase TrmD [Elusimicrobia bacterium CG1_02_37_114]PIV53176.1 MAG: tRNA (guanosine(37)-N1)-methyltransferase TrmD [Elusimicrobia bacterium CG02_land_8_20_14_3_00_37_13]PIZ12525.1 MAG: tRNA (guanosine(37)-N1)-methyltransferase TrmD [Elusimicrobia bacterium CG_4_10_14_0_8_um_filter_37_32]
MMKIDIITLFPDMFDSPFAESIVRRASKKGIIQINTHNLRDFATDKRRTVDDKPYGGGAGMVLKPEPVYRAIRKIKSKNKGTEKSKILFLSPQGKLFDQKKAKELAKEKHLILICGHYEDIDARIMKFMDEEISIGDYVLTGGELPAMVLVDAVVRLIPGVVKEKESVIQDSFYSGLLDYPHYTRPRVFRKMKVPEALLSGNHEKIRLWRLKEALRNTYNKRPGLLKKTKM